jgi:hypothetical protein
MKTLFLLSTMFLFACSDLTPEQIADLRKRCEENGMKSEFVINGWTYGVDNIVCRPK